jgi:hypothetical protein
METVGMVKVIWFKTQHVGIRIILENHHSSHSKISVKEGEL